MDTKTTGAGRFAAFDLQAVPSPAFVIDKQKIIENLSVLSQLQAESGAHILLALKAFSMWGMADIISQHLSGCCASGLWEAQLADKYYQGLLSTYSPAYKVDEIEQIVKLSDHITVNSASQFHLVHPLAQAEGCDIGLRINPQLMLGEVEKYDPSAPKSRLGVPLSQLDKTLQDIPIEQLSGLHMHSLCEQGFDALLQLAERLEPVLDRLAPHLSWLNLGGGHMLTHPDYDRAALISYLQQLKSRYDIQIYLEPGTAIAFDAGILVGEICDVIDNDGAVAITDISATCHMPDVLEAPYRPALLAEADDGIEVELGGPSCLAGDRIGSYRFAQRPEPGTRIAFLDQAHYSMVKTTTFNGVRLPAIMIWDSETNQSEILRQFSFADFEHRLS